MEPGYLYTNSKWMLVAAELSVYSNGWLRVNPALSVFKQLELFPLLLQTSDCFFTILSALEEKL